MLKRPYVIFIYGPTGVGKTDFALRLSEAYGWRTEIVNMDMGQLYKPLSIGTAKPSLSEKAVVPHHFFDHVIDPVHYSVVSYRKEFLKKIGDIAQRGNVPLVVGGSGFYLRSLFLPSDLDTTVPALPMTMQERSTPCSWEILHAIDPIRAQAIHPNDKYRIERAMDIWYTYGILPSQVPNDTLMVPWNGTVLFLWRDRTILYERINSRVVQMMEQGWIEEVAALRGTAWEKFLYEKKIIGYDDILCFLAKEQTKENLQKTITLIQQKTRHYAKRQLTFWKFFSRSLLSLATKKQECDGLNSMNLESINMGTMNIDRYIEGIIQRSNY